jgi:hypothetical protein
LKTFIRKIYESRFYPAGLCILYLLLAGAFIYIIDYYPKGDIANLLKSWVPWNLRANFIFLIIGIVLCWGNIVASFRELRAGENAGDISYFRRNYKVLLLIALVLSAFVITSFVAPRVHRIYYDEDIYASMGQVIAHTGQTGMCDFGTLDYGQYDATTMSYYKEPSGWPFLMSIVFQLLGTDELYAFFLNNVIFAAGVLVVFFMTRVLTGGFFPPFLAALVFALVPHNLIWSNTAAAEPSAAFFAGLVVLCLAVYLKTGGTRSLFMLAALTPMACQIRPESGLILLIIIGTAPLFLHGAKKNRAGESAAGSEEDDSPEAGSDKGKRWGTELLPRKEIWTAGLVTLFFLLPHFLHLYAMSGQDWGAQGAKFSTGFFLNNLSVNGPYYLNNALFPAVFTALAIVGLLFSRYDLKWRLMIFVWFLLFWGIFLFFYAGSYSYGADVRFAVVTFMPIAVLAGMGGERIRSWIEGFCEKSVGGLMRCEGAGGRRIGIVIVLVLIFTWIPFLPLVRTVGQEAWGARYDHYYAREFIRKIPGQSIVITHNPTMFLVWGQSAIQTHIGVHNPEIIRNLMDKYQGHVYFHYNFWCNIQADANHKLCQAIMETYDMEEIGHVSEKTYEYGLYKMKKK